MFSKQGKLVTIVHLARRGSIITRADLIIVAIPWPSISRAELYWYAVCSTAASLCENTDFTRAVAFAHLALGVHTPSPRRYAYTMVGRKIGKLSAYVCVVRGWDCAVKAAAAALRNTMAMGASHTRKLPQCVSICVDLRQALTSVLICRSRPTLSGTVNCCCCMLGLPSMVIGGYPAWPSFQHHQNRGPSDF
jgi:hypothetical protein